MNTTIVLTSADIVGIVVVAFIVVAVVVDVISHCIKNFLK